MSRKSWRAGRVEIAKRHPIHNAMHRWDWVIKRGQARNHPYNIKSPQNATLRSGSAMKSSILWALLLSFYSIDVFILWAPIRPPFLKDPLVSPYRLSALSSFFINITFHP